MTTGNAPGWSIMPCVWVWPLVILFAFLNVGQASAGAWVMDEGAAYQSFSVARDESDFGDGWRQEAYAESGLTRDWTLVVKLETLQRVLLIREEGEIIEREVDRTSTEIGMRRRIWQGRKTAVSAQAGVLAGEALEEDACQDVGGEGRLAVGTAAPLFGSNKVFMSAETAARFRGACERYKLDLTFGYEKGRRWLAVVKMYGEDGSGEPTLKSEIFLSRRFGKSHVGVGLRREISGQFEESSVLLSAWKRV